jgi:hypothetical protein
MMGSVALLLLVCSSWTLVNMAAAAPGPPIRAVNLGGWLVAEGWIMPSLFDNIPSKDLLVLNSSCILVVTMNELASKN